MFVSMSSSLSVLWGIVRRYWPVMKKMLAIFEQCQTIRFAGYWNIVHMTDKHKQDCDISEAFVGHHVVRNLNLYKSTQPSGSQFSLALLLCIWLRFNWKWSSGQEHDHFGWDSVPNPDFMWLRGRHSLRHACTRPRLLFFPSRPRTLNILAHTIFSNS